MKTQDKDWSGFRLFTHIRVPRNGVDCYNYLAKNGITLKKQFNTKTRKMNTAFGPELYDTLRHEDGLIVKIRDYDPIPMTALAWITVTNANEKTNEQDFHNTFYDYMNPHQVEIVKNRKKLQEERLKRGRKPLPEYRPYIAVTHIQIFKKEE